MVVHRGELKQIGLSRFRVVENDLNHHPYGGSRQTTRDHMTCGKEETYERKHGGRPSLSKPRHLRHQNRKKKPGKKPKEKREPRKNRTKKGCFREKERQKHYRGQEEKPTKKQQRHTTPDVHPRDQNPPTNVRSPNGRRAKTQKT